MDSSLAKDMGNRAWSKAWNKTKTFFGFPANTILVCIGVILLVLTLVPFGSLILSTFANKNPITQKISGYSPDN